MEDHQQPPPSLLRREDVIGRQIADIVVSVPDKPVSMSGMSASEGYIRLDTGVLINLGEDLECLRACGESRLQGLVRYTEYERDEFRSVIGKRISNVVVACDCALLVFITEDGKFITMVPAQFWIRPCLYDAASFTDETSPLWEDEQT